MAVNVADNLPLSLNSGAILLHVRVAPKSGIERVQGIESRGGRSYLKVQVTAPQEGGKANAALAATVAAWIGVPKSAIAISSGHRSRVKTLSIARGGEGLAVKIAALLKSLALSGSAGKGLSDD